MLDSNVVLDWLVFRDPSSAPVGAAIASGRLRWIATPSMRNELEHVLTRVEFSAWAAEPVRILAAWDRWARIVEAPLPTLLPLLRCTDPDDQKFIDLALEARATALLSRDRAVLKLAGRARRLGLAITTAAGWPVP